MKTYTLEVLEEANEALVGDILAALARQHLIAVSEAPSATSPILLSEDDVTQDVLTARQQPGISLAEARARFAA